jgi:DNA-binding transcriptional ArsR family regulator
MDDALRAIAEPAGEIAAHFDVNRTTVSQHLTVLKDAGLLEERRDGTRRWYRARPEALDELRRFLESMWSSSLDVARRLVESDVGIDENGTRRVG